MKIEDFLSLPWKERYEYNLEQIKNTQKIWVLRKKDKYWFYKSVFGVQLLVWCSKNFVEYCLDENNNLTFGKYKGMNADEVKSKDEEYFKWAWGYVGVFSEFSRKHNTSLQELSN